MDSTGEFTPLAQQSSSVPASTMRQSLSNEAHEGAVPALLGLSEGYTLTGTLGFLNAPADLQTAAAFDACAVKPKQPAALVPRSGVLPAHIDPATVSVRAEVGFVGEAAAAAGKSTLFFFLYKIMFFMVLIFHSKVSNG